MEKTSKNKKEEVKKTVGPLKFLHGLQKGSFSNKLPNRFLFNVFTEKTYKKNHSFFREFLSRKTFFEDILKPNKNHSLLGLSNKNNVCYSPQKKKKKKKKKNELPVCNLSKKHKFLVFFNKK